MQTLALVFAVLVASAVAVPIELSVVKDVKDSGPLCKECENLVTKLQTAMIKANATYEETTKDYLESNICGNLPTAAQDSCKSVVEEDIPAIWQQIISVYLDPVSTCEKSGFCTKFDTAPDPANCKICKKLAAYVGKKVFEDPETEAAVEAKLNAMCQKLGGQGKAVVDKCVELVVDDTPDLMEKIGESIALNLCDEIGVCGK